MRKIKDFVGDREEVYVLQNIGNRGDGLIKQGTISFFKSLNIKVKPVSFKNNNVTGDLLFVSGGGAFCNNWYHMVEAVKARYDKFKQIVLLPSTFDISCPIVKEWAESLPSHVTVFCRDKISYASMRSLNSNVFLEHDMAFYFDVSAYKKQGEGTLIAFRKDSESGGHKPIVESYDHAEDVSAGRLEEHDYFLRTLSKYQTIHTDRLHIAIGGAMLGKDVVLYPNSYFKNKGVYEYSLHYFNNVKIYNPNLYTKKINTSYIEPFVNKQLSNEDSSNYVSLICAIMNRDDTLRVTLTSWLKFKEIGEIVIVDWSSDKEIRWVLDLDPRIKLIRVQSQKYFNISKAYNLALDHATKKYVLKMDVDYMLNPYYNFFELNPRPDKNYYYAGNFSRGKDTPIFAYLNGFNYAHRVDLLAVNGYNENFKGYGYDDDDLCGQLNALGRKKLNIKYDYSIMHIPHPNELRTTNYEYKKLTWQYNKAISANTASINRRIATWQIETNDNRYFLAEEKKNSIKIDKQNDSNWTQFEDEESYDYSHCDIIGKINFPLKGTLPSNGIYRSLNSIVYDDGMVLDLITSLPYHDIYWFNDGSHIKMANSLYDRPHNNVKYKQGTCLNLLSPWSEVNYGHYILDVMTKIDIVKAACDISLEDFDYILLPAKKGKEIHQILKHFGLDKLKVLHPISQHQYKFDEVYTPSLRGAPRLTRKNSLKSVKEAFCLNNVKQTKRLYITRNGYYRNCINEKEVSAFLESYGFEKINPAYVNNCHELFNSAEIIVGAHGAGLTNIMFCQPKTKVIELMPYAHRYPWYMSLGCAHDLDYNVIVCGDNNKFEVDILKLKNLIKKYCGFEAEQ